MSPHGESHSHSSDILHSETLLDELHDHLELATFAGLSRIRDRDGWSRSLLVELVVVGCAHGGQRKGRKSNKKEMKENKGERAVSNNQEMDGRKCQPATGDERGRDYQP